MKLISPATGFGLMFLPVISMTSALIARSLSDVPLPWTQAWSNQLEEQARSLGIPTIGFDGVENILMSGSHLVLDARPMEEYDAGHLPGSLPLPEHDFEAQFPGIAPMLFPEGPILTYCSGTDCDSALQLALRLKDAGFTNVVLYTAGYGDWSSRSEAAGVTP